MPRKKQRRAWGSVTEVQRGKKYVLRWPDASKRCGRATETFRGTYRQACERLDVIHAEILAAGGNRTSATVGEVWRKYVLPEYERRVESGDFRKSSFDLYIRQWEKRAEPRWGDVPLDDVKAVDVQEWLDSMTLANANIAMKTLNRIGDVAVNYELAGDNVFRRRYTMPAPGNKRDATVYDLATAERVLTELRGKRSEGAFIVACFGGARTSEALGIKIEEIEYLDFPSGMYALVPIVRQIKDGGKETSEMKTRQSRRATVIPPPYSRRLREIASAVACEGFQWLTAKPSGEPYGRAAFGHVWRKECANHIPFQNLRTSWRTFAEVEWDISSRLLEMLMGHKLEGVTGAHYIRANAAQTAEKFEREYAKNVSC